MLFLPLFVLAKTATTVMRPVERLVMHYLNSISPYPQIKVPRTANAMENICKYFRNLGSVSPTTAGLPPVKTVEENVVSGNLF